MTWEIVFTLVAVHAAAVISPGPNMLSVMDSSLNFGAARTLPFILGILLGNVVHIAYSIALTSYAIALSPTFRLALAIAGGLYLGYAGIARLCNSTAPARRTSRSNRFASGFAVNITNPKGILLFVSVYSVIIPVGVPLLAKLSCGIWMLLVNFIFLSSLAFAISSKAAAAVVNANLAAINRLTGCMLIVIAAALVCRSLWPA